MNMAPDQLVRAIHASGRQSVIVAAGGGTSAVAMLLAVPGASRSILEAVVPYASESLAEFLGQAPLQTCSAATAHLLAAKALDRARHLSVGPNLVGLACTASLASDRPKRGEHRFHIATHTPEESRRYSLVLAKGCRSRHEEEDLVSACILNELAGAAGVTGRLLVPLREDEQPEAAVHGRGGIWGELEAGSVSAVCIECDGRLTYPCTNPQLVVPGSFNPLHEAHRTLARVASEVTGFEAVFELSLTNVDKPPLSREEARRRVRQLHWFAPIWITRAPLFTDKADVFPGAMFAVGADTALRLVEPRYYQYDANRMAQGLCRIRDRGCRFLVAGRAEVGGHYLDPEKLPIPLEFRDLFTSIPRPLCDSPFSSTMLRGRRKDPENPENCS